MIPSGVQSLPASLSLHLPNERFNIRTPAVRHSQVSYLYRSSRKMSLIWFTGMRLQEESSLSLHMPSYCGGHLLVLSELCGNCDLPPVFALDHRIRRIAKMWERCGSGVVVVTRTRFSRALQLDADMQFREYLHSPADHVENVGEDGIGKCKLLLRDGSSLQHYTGAAAIALRAAFY